MRQHDHSTPASRWRRSGLAAAGLSLAALTLSGCASADLRGDASTGWLPKGVTQESQSVTTLWIGAWVTLILVGLLVYVLTAWCLIRYRRKPGDHSLPVQLRYNVPIEILYTVLPIFAVVVFFYYTDRDTTALQDTSAKPDVTVNVVGKQWSWDFNYLEDDVYAVGTQAVLDGKPGAEETLPNLYLPVNERVEFVLTSRDVIHSFWVPAFLEKLDMIPGRVNKFQVVPTQEGTFKGKCAELCGAYHSQMLFNVKVVSRAEYDRQMQALRDAGQTGMLGSEYNRADLMNDQDALDPTSGK